MSGFIFDIPRKVLVDKAVQAKKTLIRMMEDASRDLEVQRSLFDEYVKCQRAADVLCEIEQKEMGDKMGGLK